MVTIQGAMPNQVNTVIDFTLRNAFGELSKAVHIFPQPYVSAGHRHLDCSQWLRKSIWEKQSGKLSDMACDTK